MNLTKDFLKDFYKTISHKEIEADLKTSFDVVVFYLHAFELWIEKKAAPVQQTTSYKQEIAALAEAYSVFEDSNSKALSALLMKLRQLSAM